jgi:hypothetical protein
VFDFKTGTEQTETKGIRQNWIGLNKLFCLILNFVLCCFVLFCPVLIFYRSNDPLKYVIECVRKKEVC